MKNEKKLWKQLARDGIILAIAGALSALIWPVSRLLGNNSDWIYKLSNQLPWVFFLLSVLTAYYFIKAADDTRRGDETASKTASEQKTARTLLDNAVANKVQRILGEAKNNTSTSLPLKEDSLCDLDMAYDETLYSLKDLIAIKMLSPWEKSVARNEDGIIMIRGNMARFGYSTCRVYLYDDFRIANPSTENGFESALNVSDEFIDKLIDDAVAKIAEEVVAIGRSIEAKARPSSSNTLNVPSDQPLEVTKVVLFAPLPESAANSSFTL